MRYECPFCSIASGKVQADVVYEDKYVVAILKVKAAAAGHIVLFPKAHHPIMETIDEPTLAYVAAVARNIAITLKRALGAAGINILVKNGYEAGQDIAHFAIDIIPRYKDDGIKLEWKPISISDAEQDRILTALNQRAAAVQHVGKIDSSKENYLIKHLTRTS